MDGASERETRRIRSGCPPSYVTEKDIVQKEFKSQNQKIHKGPPPKGRGRTAHGTHSLGKPPGERVAQRSLPHETQGHPWVRPQPSKGRVNGGSPFPSPRAPACGAGASLRAPSPRRSQVQLKHHALSAKGGNTRANTHSVAYGTDNEKSLHYDAVASRREKHSEKTVLS